MKIVTPMIDDSPSIIMFSALLDIQAGIALEMTENRFNHNDFMAMILHRVVAAISDAYGDDAARLADHIRATE
jgi:cation transporter-like permease